MIKKEKPIRVKRAKTNELEKYVLEVSEILGIEEGKYVRTKSGFFAVLKILGIDILSFSDDDRNRSMDGFARAIGRMKCESKYIFMDVKPDLSAQKDIFKGKLEGETHEFRRYLIERQLAYLNYIENNIKDRCSYLMVFSSSKQLIDKSVSGFISAMTDTPIEICSELEITGFLRSILQPGGGLIIEQTTE